jgi:GT2 family glycosyltransferase
MRITALVACHDRRESTLASLGAFFSQSVGPDDELDAVLVDDGSSDGTAQAVEASYAKAEVLRSSGDLFWAASMALADLHASGRDPDYFLWLNDDVIIDTKGLSRMLEVGRRWTQPCIVVGAVRDSLTGDVTYSGIRRRGLGLHPLRVELVQPADRPVVVSMFNGNVVLIPREVRRVLGSIDGKFAHGLADFDYGLRAAKAGISSVLAPGTVGTCTRQAPAAPWLGPNLGVRARVEYLLGPKGFPPRSAARYLRRHGGLLWPLFWVAPYIRQTYFMLRAKRLRLAVK